MPLLVLDAVAFAVWGTCLAGISVPFWYWSIPQKFANGQTAYGLNVGSFPNGPDGPGGVGFFIGDLPSALLLALACAAPLLAANYLVVAAARLHAQVATRLLGGYDPLAEAKEVLAGPGPLPTLPR